MKQFSYANKVIYSSFHLPSILKLKKLDPTAKIAWLLVDELSRPSEYVQSLELEGLHLYKDILLKNVDVYENNENYHIRAWTVNDVSEMEQLFQMKYIDTIMTDFPKKAISLRNTKQ